MFSALNKVEGLDLPLFETRKALIIINLQNDSLYAKDDLYITKNRDFVPRLKEMIPYFREHGDVVWVCTHMSVLPSAPSPDAAKVEAEASEMAEKNRKEQNMKEQQMQENISREEEGARTSQLDEDLSLFHPSSRTKRIMTRPSEEIRAEKRSADLQAFNDRENVFGEHLSKPRKGQQARFFIGGTKGAEICDDLLDVVDYERDLIVTKHHYSAFDQTSLLMALRTKLVMEVYLCGCLTNVSVYSTAADAVQHGLQVTVVEDCLGYRSEAKHEEAMQQMADIMGVHGIDSEEIIEESGGRPVPDSAAPGITLEELSLNTDAAGKGSVMVEIQQRNIAESQGAAPLPTAVAGPAQQSDQALTRSNSVPKPPSSPSAARNRSSWNMSKLQTLGPNDKMGSGDSRIILAALSSPLINTSFQRLKDEVGWQTMLHRSGQVPRLVAVQGDAGKDGEIPLYRHPADESPPLLPFTETVQRIREEAESQLGQSFNHALIQLYRDGIDNISEHADKTLDLVRGSSIINVSIGAQRTMTLRTKKSKHGQGMDSPGTRQSQRIKMPHNSIFVLGPQTNREWLHGVRADKRPGQEKTDEEKGFGGERISITFRQIGTFMDKNKKTIWGTGATQKRKAKASKISTRDSAQMKAMIYAFGKENHDTDFDWNAEYGPGFDVVNLINKQAKLILCQDSVANIRAQLALCEKSISYTVTKQEICQYPPQEELQTRFHFWIHGLSNSENPIFQDNDENGKKTEGDLAIMFYLEEHYPFAASLDEGSSQQPDRQTYISQTAQSNELLFTFRQLRDARIGGGDSLPTHRHKLERPLTPNKSLMEEFHASMQIWEDRAAEARFVAGDAWTILDCAFWPVLDYILEHLEGMAAKEEYPNLIAYHQRVAERECVRAVLEGGNE